MLVHEILRMCGVHEPEKQLLKKVTITVTPTRFDVELVKFAQDNEGKTIIDGESQVLLFENFQLLPIGE